MSELLAIEWEHEHVCGVLAQLSPGRVRVERTFVIAKPSAAASSSGPLQLDWLKPELSRLGITGGDVLVALPRDEAVVKRLELPEAPDEELPVLVRFQAGAKSSVALEDLALDFIPLPRRSDVPGREALMATVPRQTIDELQLVCRKAGLQPVMIGLTAAAVAEFVARAESAADASASGASLVVARHGNRIEVSMLHRCHLIFSHSARLSEDATGQKAQAIVAEVSRALVALRGASGDVKIERAWTLVSASEHEHLAESLKRRLQCEVSPLDPFASVERDPRVADAIADRSLFAGPIGMLLAKADPRVPGLDFLSPRQPAVKRDTRRQRTILAGAGAAALVLILGGAHWLRLSNLDAEIEALGARENELNEALKKAEPTNKAAEAVAKWKADGADWLEELTELAARMPPTERVYLRSLRMIPRQGPTAAAKINLDGFSREREDATKLNDLFLAADHFQGQPVAEHQGKKETDFYKWEFNKELRLVAGKAKPAEAKNPAAQPAAGTPAAPDSKAPPAAPPAASNAAATRERASS